MNKIQVVIEGIVAEKISSLAKALEMQQDLLVFKLIMDGLSRQDQTEDEWLLSTKPEDPGTGIFLVSDVANPQPGSVKKVLVPNITYDDCVRRGQGVSAFKWVPHTVFSSEELSSGSCSYGPADKD